MSILLFILGGLGMAFIGAAMLEMGIVLYTTGEGDLGSMIFAGSCALLFLLPGIFMIYTGIREAIEKHTYPDWKKVRKTLTPGFKEAVGKGKLDRQLVSFREHYSDFFARPDTNENEQIQKDVSQIYRSLMQFRKNRLNQLGLTCEMIIRRMAYTSADGITTARYSDGKYSMTDVTEEVAAKTIYRKNGKEIFTKADKETANYTIIKAKQVGKDHIICPSCGTETTREALLDGCDYCGTKFSVEDLANCITSFTFRPDPALRAEKQRRSINRLWAALIIASVAAVFVGFTVLAVLNWNTLLKETNSGVLTGLLGSLFAILIASPVYIISYLITNPVAVLPILVVMALISCLMLKRVRSIKKVPVMSQALEKTIRAKDPHFSFANFYSGLQNKLASVFYAQNTQQINAFAGNDLSGLLDTYQDVVGVDADYMMLRSFYWDEKYQYANVDVALIVTRYDGRKCRVKNEKLNVSLIKDAGCLTQAVCAPTVMKCPGCGASLDLLKGRNCEYCGRALNLEHYDWVIDRIQPVNA